MCLQENFILAIFNKRNMKVVKEIHIFEQIDRRLLQKKNLNAGNIDRDRWEQEPEINRYKVLLKNHSTGSFNILTFEDSTILILKYNENNATDINAYVHKLLKSENGDSSEDEITDMTLMKKSNQAEYFLVAKTRENKMIKYIFQGQRNKKEPLLELSRHSLTWNRLYKDLLYLYYSDQQDVIFSVQRNSGTVIRFDFGTREERIIEPFKVAQKFYEVNIDRAKKQARDAIKDYKKIMKKGGSFGILRSKNK